MVYQNNHGLIKLDILNDKGLVKLVLLIWHLVKSIILI
jgi:hypothetical protein